MDIIKAMDREQKRQALWNRRALVAMWIWIPLAVTTFVIAFVQPGKDFIWFYVAFGISLAGIIATMLCLRQSVRASEKVCGHGIAAYLQELQK